MVEFVIDRVEVIVEKGENAIHQSADDKKKKKWVGLMVEFVIDS